MADGMSEEYLDFDAAHRDADRMLSECYQDLKILARRQRRLARLRSDMLTTDLLHESYLKLQNSGDWKDRAHFMRTAALAMRQIVIDHARKYASQKRGSNAIEADIDEIADWLSGVEETPEQLVIIGDLMQKLWEKSPRAAMIAECRYFAGFTERETADALSVSDRTVRREWAQARAWLIVESGMSEL